MHNNLDTTIKIFRATYLLLVALFTSVPLYWYHVSWVHKTRKFVYDTSKTGSNPNRFLSATIRLLRAYFKFIKFYTYGLKVLYSLISPGKENLIHVDIIFAAPNFGYSKHHISANNVFC